MSRKQAIKNQLKEHMPKDWLTDIRLIYRIVMEAVNDIKRTGFMNIVIITTMAAILSIFGALFRSTLSMAQFANELGSILEISAYLKPDAPAKVLANKFAHLDHVINVRVHTKEEGWKDLRKVIDLPNISNPLPDTLRVKVDDIEYIDGVISKIKSNPYVESTNYPETLAKRLQVIIHVVNTTTIVVTLIVAMLTITIINNTIQLVIQSRKDEIEIMRLMGVSNWYIRIPLVLQGAFYGFAGAIISLIPLHFVQSLIGKMNSFFLIPTPMFAESMIVLTLIAVGTLFGALGSLLSIKKHLQV
ncbi:MAG: ABC transporter permease [Cyanobacteria bacterium RUI128]|nr:ABC transporter permease [Cyanobacteria bacterium RUI128]